MYKVLVACGNGMGTSMLIKMKAETTFKKVGLEATFDHGAVGEAASMAGSYDIVFCPQNLVNQFDAYKNRDDVKIIGMVNVLSEEEMIDKLRENGYIS